MACAKLSLVLLIQSLLAEKYSLLAGRGLLAIIIVWTIGSILAQSFQCSIPHPWDSTGKCNNQVSEDPPPNSNRLTGSYKLAIHDAIASVNIITDASLILLPCVVFVKIQVSKSRRYGIMALFAIRILYFNLSSLHLPNTVLTMCRVCVATGVQARYFKSFTNSADKTCKPEDQQLLCRSILVN
jgi:hypothetical protein